MSQAGKGSAGAGLPCAGWGSKYLRWQISQVGKCHGLANVLGWQMFGWQMSLNSKYDRLANVIEWQVSKLANVLAGNCQGGLMTACKWW